MGGLPADQQAWGLSEADLCDLQTAVDAVVAAVAVAGPATVAGVVAVVAELVAGQQTALLSFQRLVWHRK